jgi:hypothetical protein
MATFRIHKYKQNLKNIIFDNDEPVFAGNERLFEKLDHQAQQRKNRRKLKQYEQKKKKEYAIAHPEMWHPYKCHCKCCNSIAILKKIQWRINQLKSQKMDSKVPSLFSLSLKVALRLAKLEP